MKLIIDKNKCNGCKLCTQVCPQMILQFIDNQNGFIGTHESDLFKTVDGGENWIRYIQDIQIFSLYFVNQDTGWIAGGKIEKTTDSGITFNVQKSGDGFSGLGIKSIFF